MIDSHCHLADEAFVGDLDDAIARSQAAGIDRALCILAAGDDAETVRAERVRRTWPAVRFAAGVHPHHAGRYAAHAEEAAGVTLAQAQRFRACAIGEIGLDYHNDFAPRDVQRDVFAAQIALAQREGLPIIVHTREATDDTFDVIRAAGGVQGVFHCFTGDVEMAERANAIGFYVSFAGILTFPKAESLREAALRVPVDRLLIETDSPYLAPVPHRGVRNEPAFVGRVLERLAAVRGEPVPALEAALAANFDRLFGTNQVRATA